MSGFAIYYNSKHNETGKLNMCSQIIVFIPAETEYLQKTGCGVKLETELTKWESSCDKGKYRQIIESLWARSQSMRVTLEDDEVDRDVRTG